MHGLGRRTLRGLPTWVWGMGVPLRCEGIVAVVPTVSAVAFYVRVVLCAGALVLGQFRHGRRFWQVCCWLHALLLPLLPPLLMHPCVGKWIGMCCCSAEVSLAVGLGTRLRGG